MNKKNWLDAIGKQGYVFSVGAELIAVNLLLSEICRLPSARRRSFMGRFMREEDGEIRVDYEKLLRELHRIAEETYNELVDMERLAGVGLTKQQISLARSQLLKDDFAILKTMRNPDFMRLLTDLYKNV